MFQQDSTNLRGDGEGAARQLGFVPCSHMVQLYEGVESLMDSLERFLGEGLEEGDAVVVLATPTHRVLLEARLLERGIDVAAARASHRYIDLDAEETLQSFMLGGWPDPARFEDTVEGLLDRARGEGRRVRAFGEMVAVLWSRGHFGAVVSLERMWQAFCQRQPDLSLLCAYPRIRAERGNVTALAEVLEAHTNVLENAP